MDINIVADEDGDMSDQQLTKEERRNVASVIDGVMPNIRHLGEDDWRNFTLLMYELHQKKFNLLSVDVKDDFGPYCKSPFPENVIDEMQKRIDCVSELVFGQYEKQQDGRGDYSVTQKSSRLSELCAQPFLITEYIARHG